MQPAHSIAQAGSFVIMKTDHGEHTARQWARVTVGQIVQVDDAATPERRAQIVAMKHDMVEALEPFFRTPSPVQAPLAFDTLLGAVKDTLWAVYFNEPNVRAQIFMCLERNLRR